jgi:hypothetical protein
MTNDHDYCCLLSPRDVMGFETIADEEWSAISWSRPERHADLRIRCNALRIHTTNVKLTIGVRAVDLEPKLEAFRLVAHDASDWSRSAWQHPAEFEDSDELMSAFIGKQHALFIGARAHPFDGADSSRSFLVEDVLIMRHHSGQQVYVSPDDDVPGSLVVQRDRRSLPFPTAVFRYLRAL